MLSGKIGNSCSVKVGGVVVEGMMRLEGWGTCVRLQDRIACTALPVPTPDLEMPTPATARCGRIRIFEGGSPNGQPPLFPRRDYE